MSRPVFVFGSNLAGRHGKGAALTAHLDHGAERGVGEGRTGNAYAIPTKDERLRSLPLFEIEQHIAVFLNHARENPETTFHLTPIGCGLAGYSRREVWAILAHHGVPPNVLLTSTWVTP